VAQVRAVLIWIFLIVCVALPVVVAANSPLLAWREPVYIVAGFAAIFAMALVLFQPLLAGGYLPGLSTLRERRIHRWVGIVLVAAVIVHVVGLWITSPPDVIDALLFRSPTPFSAWGVVAMWALFATAAIAARRRQMKLRLSLWRIIHTTLAAIVVTSSIVHAMLIEGTMGTISKTLLCVLVLLATIKAFFDLRVWTWRISNRQS